MGCPACPALCQVSTDPAVRVRVRWHAGSFRALALPWSPTPTSLPHFSWACSLVEPLSGWGATRGKSLPGASVSSSVK